MCQFGLISTNKMRFWTLLVVIWVNHSKANVASKLADIENDWGSYLSEALQKQLSALESLTAKLEEAVHNRLKPARILESKLKIRLGINGITVVNFFPSGIKFIVKNKHLYQCFGKISDENGRCYGQLDRFQFTRKEDFCFVLTKTQVHHHYCISTANVNVFYINGVLDCAPDIYAPFLKISVNEYREICSKFAAIVYYTYYTQDYVYDVGLGLVCRGTQLQTCTMKEELIKQKSYQECVHYFYSN